MHAGLERLLIALALAGSPAPATGQAACTGMPGNDSRFCDSGFRWYRVDFSNPIDVKLTTDPNSTIAALAPWSETDIGGPHPNESTPTVTHRTKPPFQGAPSVMFRGSNQDNEGAQWVMWQGQGFAAAIDGLNGSTASRVFTRPLDLAYYATVGWPKGLTGAVGTSGTLLGLMVPGTPLDSDGTLDDHEFDGDPTAQTWGFYVDSAWNLHAVVADTTVLLIDEDTNIDIEPERQYQLGFTAHISGWGYAGGDYPCVEIELGGPPPTESWIRWYVDGNLVLDLPAVGTGGGCIQVTPNMTPGVAHVRTTGPTAAPIISRMGYGFSYFE